MTEGVEWGTVAQYLAPGVAIVLAIWAKISNRNDKLQSDMSRAFERIDSCEARLASIETDMRHLPNKDLVHTLQIAITEMRGELKVIAARVEPIKAISERLQENMLEHGK